MAASASVENRVRLAFIDTPYVICNVDGSVIINGKLQDVTKATSQYMLQLTLSGLTDLEGASSTPLTLLKDACYVSSKLASPVPLTNKIDPSTWQYYTTVNESLLSISNDNLIEFSSTGGQATQFGVGASGMSVGYGALVTLQYKISATKTDEAQLYLGKLADDQCDLSAVLSDELLHGKQIDVDVALEKKAGACEGEAKWVKTWTACAHQSCVSASQNIYIRDTTSPSFTSVPKDIQLSCSDSLPTDQPTIEDACDQGAKMSPLPDEIFDQVCQHLQD